MAAGLRLEEVLLHVARACEGEGDPSLYGEETARFVQHAFFCYDTSGVAGGQSVMPLNAVAEEGSFMMLFTGPELLELARPSLMHVGVAVNVYVPGLDARYMAPALRKKPLCRLFA